MCNYNIENKRDITGNSLIVRIPIDVVDWSALKTVAADTPPF